MMFLTLGITGSADPDYGVAVGRTPRQRLRQYRSRYGLADGENGGHAAAAATLRCEEHAGKVAIDGQREEAERKCDRQIAACDLELEQSRDNGNDSEHPQCGRPHPTELLRPSPHHLLRPSVINRQHRSPRQHDQHRDRRVGNRRVSRPQAAARHVSESQNVCRRHDTAHHNDIRNRKPTAVALLPPCAKGPGNLK